LRNAGIQVERGVCEAQAKALNPGFILRMTRGRPWVRVKLAMSLDGRTALPSGESQWITGEAARTDVQRLRARSSAILTGTGTLLTDDPSLNVRLSPEALAVEGEVRQPLRVILDTALRTSRDARVFNLSGHTLLFTAVEQGKKTAQLESAGADICRVPKAGGGLDLTRVMDELARRQVNEVQVEAGPTLCGALLEAGLVDELVCYMAPHLMGDAGRGLFHLPAIKTMAQRIKLEISDLRTVGTDIRITARPTQRREH
jgi:diaminohydroxyphosphoribosylaminopyrimidine deaminase/5-amino-6-(5-phosphoribosylamino)uracil reductase